jgi:hypothetical protein
MSSEEETNKKCENDVCELPESSDTQNESSQVIPSTESPSKTNFWFEDPNILLNLSQITEIYPTPSMDYNRKLNAITRLVLYVTIIIFMLTQNSRVLFISAITIGSIYLVFQYHKKEGMKGKKDGFSDIVSSIVKDTLDNDPDTTLPDIVFEAPNPYNPYNNVLVSDYDYNIYKKPAPPIYNQNVSTDVLTQAKQLVRDANGDQPEIVDKLFKDLGEQYVFEQSLRPFYSNPSTTIPNDQQAFAEFCYGSMVSCKEGNKFACARNLARYTN